MVLSDESNDDIIAIPVFGGMNGEDDGATGINVQSSIFNLQSDGVYYNLQGLRVDKPGKGVFIRNGKKVVIKWAKWELANCINPETSMRFGIIMFQFVVMWSFLM